MRFVVYGAGAVGGVVGARLHEGGHDVLLIARGEHAGAIRERGLRIQSPEGEHTVRIEVAEHPSRARFRADDVVLLAMKSQDTSAALSALEAVAPAEVPVVCAQNGVENERAALRRFENVYGVCVMLPATHLEPGVVQANSAPVTGLLDIGRYPEGLDDTARAIATAFAESTFDSRAVANVMRWKYRKLVMNLGNALEVLFPLDSEYADKIDKLARAEGEACLIAADIDFASREEDRVRRDDLLQLKPIGGDDRGGGSTWQSLARGTGASEVDYLNGEIVLLGRIHDLPTPVNEALHRFANLWARERRPPGTLSAAEFEREVETR